MINDRRVRQPERINSPLRESPSVHLQDARVQYLALLQRRPHGPV
jgi:hypothetical protein